MGAIEILMWGQVMTEIAEGISRIIETAQKMQRGEPVTKADLAAARKRTDDAMARLEAAAKEAKKDGTNDDEA